MVQNHQSCDTNFNVFTPHCKDNVVFCISSCHDLFVDDALCHCCIFWVYLYVNFIDLLLECVSCRRLDSCTSIYVRFLLFC